MNERKQLVEKSKLLEPSIRIGKNGITPGVVEEIKNRLKRDRLVKVKFLKGALEAKDRKELGKEIAMQTGAELIHQVGFVVVLYK